MTSRHSSGTEESSPLVSVIIPTFGRSEYLPDAIKSVVKQTYDNIELIIVDDGSEVPVAETIDVDGLDRLRSVTFLRHNENKGANVARNSGIQAANGEYIAFLDDDDWWHETKVSQQVAKFDPEIGVVYTGVQAEAPDGMTVMTPTAEGDVMKDLLVGKSFGQFSAIMVRSEIIDAAGLPDERFPAWQDREWLFRLAQYCHFKPVHDTLTYRRVGLPDRITRKFEEKRDIAYPLFLKKHYPLAHEHGRYYARMFLASLRTKLARSAIRVDRYRQARKYFLLAFFANPFYRDLYPNLIASLGGRWTYEPASFLRKSLKSIRSSFK